MTGAIYALIAATAGSAIGSILACVPALHVYNVMGLAAIGVHSLAASGIELPPEVIVPFMAAMIVGWSMANSIPSILLAAPDESALFTVLPGQKYAMQGRGFEAAMITAVGGLAGVFLLILLVGPLAPLLLPAARVVLQRHTHWILWVVIVFLLLSEWPKFGTSGQGGWSKFLQGWTTTGAGLLTFLLAGLQGFILHYRSPISVNAAFQNLMPAFVGLFAMPWLILNIMSRVDLPRQQTASSLRIGKEHVLRGAGAGLLGGMFAAFFPGITGGIGGLLAGHATAQRDDRVFLVSQGASKLVYYVGAFLLFFVPSRKLVRGTAASLLNGIYVPHTRYDYYMLLASIALAGALAFMLMGPLTRGTIRLIRRFNYRRISCGALAVMLVLVLALTGWMGLLVMIVATGIGLIPVLFNSRRINCLGVILLPMACGMSGKGAIVAGWLGLL